MFGTDRTPMSEVAASRLPRWDWKKPVAIGLLAALPIGGGCGATSSSWRVPTAAQAETPGEPTAGTAVNGVVIHSTPSHTTAERVAEVYTETAQFLGIPASGVVRFVPSIDGERYTAGTARKDGSIEVRETLTRDLELTIVHEVAHLATMHLDDVHHGQAWCDAYLAAVGQVLPERYEGQQKQTGTRYGCLRTIPNHAWASTPTMLQYSEHG